MRVVAPVARRAWAIVAAGLGCLALFLFLEIALLIRGDAGGLGYFTLPLFVGLAVGALAYRSVPISDTILVPMAALLFTVTTSVMLWDAASAKLIFVIPLGCAFFGASVGKAVRGRVWPGIIAMQLRHAGDATNSSNAGGR